MNNELIHIVQFVFGNENYSRETYRSNYTMYEIEQAYEKSCEDAELDFDAICEYSPYLYKDEKSSLENFGIDVDKICLMCHLSQHDYSNIKGWKLNRNVLEHILFEFIGKSLKNFKIERQDDVVRTFSRNIGKSIFNR